MKDLLIAGLFYAPAWLVGQQLAHYVDPFLAGWLVCGAAAVLRMQYLHATGKLPPSPGGHKT